MRFEAGASNPASLPGVIRTVCEAGIYGDGHGKTEKCTTQREGNRDLATVLFLLSITGLYFKCLSFCTFLMPFGACGLLKVN